MKDDNILQLQKDLSLEASVSFFECTQVEKYRASLSKCLRRVVLLANKKETTEEAESYKTSAIQKCLAPPLPNSRHAHQSAGYSIQWKGLMLHHDRVRAQEVEAREDDTTLKRCGQQKNQNRTSGSLTALSVLVNLLAYDPLVLPHAYSQELFMVFFRALIQVTIPRPPRPEKHWVPRSKWTASQSIFLDAMEHILVTRPSCSMAVGPLLVNYVRFQLLPHWQTSAQTIQNMDCDPLHRMAGVLKHLAASCKSQVLGVFMLECLMRAVQGVDYADVGLLRYREKLIPIKTASTKETICNKCRTSRRGPKLSAKSLSNLHDGSNVNQIDPSGLVQSTVQVSGGFEVNRISRRKGVKIVSPWLGQKSVKDILKRLPPTGTIDTPGSLFCERCGGFGVGSTTRSTHPSEFTQLPLKTGVFLRSRLYRKAVSVFTRLTMSDGAEQQILRHATQMVVNCHQSTSAAYSCASLRTCLVLFADVVGPDGYKFLLEYIWSLYEQARGRIEPATKSGPTISKGELLLRIYSESIVECSVFDDPDLFWKAIQPLVSSVLDTCRRLHQVAQGSLEAISTDDSAEKENMRPLLRCITYILGRRRGVIFRMNREVVRQASDRFSQFISQLSLFFGDPDIWVSPEMSHNEKEEIVQTLQVSGILSFFDSSSDDTDEIVNRNVSVSIKMPRPSNIVKSCLQWPFPELTGLRSTHRRMGPHVGRRDLLSSLKPEPAGEIVLEEQKRNSVASKTSRYPDERVVVVSMLDYLNNDVLATVFSFLGYKRLVRVGGVCRSWRSLSSSNTLWQQLYRTRFGIQQDDGFEAACPGVTLNWKDTFVKKWISERELRFKRSSSGWKYRTCGYIGCYQVLKSRKQMNAHYRLHKAKAEKEEDRKMKRLKKRKRKKDAEIKQRKKKKKNKRTKASKSVDPDKLSQRKSDSTARYGTPKLESREVQSMCSEDEAFLQFLQEEYERSNDEHVENRSRMEEVENKDEAHGVDLEVVKPFISPEDEVFAGFVNEHYGDMDEVGEHSLLKKQPISNRGETEAEPDSPESICSEDEAFRQYLLEQYPEHCEQECK